MLLQFCTVLLNMRSAKKNPDAFEDYKGIFTALLQSNKDSWYFVEKVEVLENALFE